MEIQEEMKKFMIVLPDAAFNVAEEEAEKAGVDVATLCAMKLSDILIAGPSLSGVQAMIAAPAPPLRPPVVQMLSSRSTVSGDLTLESLPKVFAGFPEKSRRYAERIFEEVYRFPGVTAKLRPNGRGVVFNPNFVTIEYLRSRSGGIAVSLGAPKRMYRNAPETLKRGRTESYSWIMIDSDGILDSVVPLLKQTWDIRYSSAPRSRKRGGKFTED